MVGTGASFVRVVSDFGPFDEFAVEGKNRRVEIEEKAGARPGKEEHLQPQLVVNLADILGYFWVRSFQEAP
jgi:hypothetical protein